MNKILYFKNKLLDFRIKIFAIEIKLYFSGPLSYLLSLFSPSNYATLIKIHKNNKPENILVIELNKFHSEIFPSWLFYLKKLSYQNKIFFLGSKFAHKFRSFDLIDPKENCGYSFLKMDPRIILLCYKLGLFSNYKKVIFNSDIFYFSPLEDWIKLLSFLRNKSVLKNTVFLSHDILKTITCKNDSIDYQNQIITISPSISRDANIKFVVPLNNENSFISNSEKEKNFNQKKVFISCGDIKTNSKDCKGLIAALEETKTSSKIINIIGKAKGAIKNDRDVIYQERASCLEMKKALQNSHFIFFLLNNAVSYRYKFDNSSGTLPLALNFNLIPIIEESFAKFYCLDETNAIIHKENQLALAIDRACNMKYDEYLKMQSSLEALKTKLKEESLNNINKILT